MRDDIFAPTVPMLHRIGHPSFLRKGPEAVSTSVALGARALKISPVKRRCDKFSKAEEEFVVKSLFNELQDTKINRKTA